MPPQTVNDRVMHGVSNSNLPPSVEAAYYRKCIELKRRVNEIESNNDKMRTSIERSHRACDKLRLERNVLIAEITRQTAQKETGSQKSESPPPTPQEKPTRTKRSRKQGTPTVDGSAAAATSPLAASPTAAQDNGHPAPSSPTPLNGDGARKASSTAAHENGNGELDDQEKTQNGSTEDVIMAEGSPDHRGFGGGFTAVNR